MDASFVVMSFAIGAGSALGGMLRYWCSFLIARTLGETFPLGTLFVNVVGSFLIVLFAEVTGPDGRLLVSSLARQFVMVGSSVATRRFFVPPANPQPCVEQRTGAGAHQC